MYQKARYFNWFVCFFNVNYMMKFMNVESLRETTMFPSMV